MWSTQTNPSFGIYKMHCDAIYHSTSSYKPSVYNQYPLRIICLCFIFNQQNTTNFNCHSIYAHYAIIALDFATCFFINNIAYQRQTVIWTSQGITSKELNHNHAFPFHTQLIAFSGLKGLQKTVVHKAGRWALDNTIWNPNEYMVLYFIFNDIIPGKRRVQKRFLL